MELIGVIFAFVLIIIARLLGANKDAEKYKDKRSFHDQYNDWSYRG
jgi:hypothetical protein